MFESSIKQFLCTWLKRSLHPEVWIQNLVHEETKKMCADLKTTSRLPFDFFQYKMWKNRRCILTVRHCVHCGKGKKGQRQFTYHLLSLITGNKTNMLLIIFLSLIGKLTSVSGDCDVGIREVKNFDWDKVRIAETSSFYFSFSVYYFIKGFIKVLSIVHILIHFRGNYKVLFGDYIKGKVSYSNYRQISEFSCMILEKTQRNLIKILGVFAKLRVASIYFENTVFLIATPTTPYIKLSINLIFEYFSQICVNNQVPF
jgi:hypothetical protein